jgi:hypothetical protein
MHDLRVDLSDTERRVHLIGGRLHLLLLNCLQLFSAEHPLRSTLGTLLAWRALSTWSHGDRLTGRPRLSVLMLSLHQCMLSPLLHSLSLRSLGLQKLMLLRRHRRGRLGSRTTRSAAWAWLLRCMLVGMTKLLTR